MKMKMKINYGITYLAFCPIFAVIFFLLPAGWIDYGDLPDTILTNLYFSVVTITTLGYGDVTPINEIAATLVALESILGVVFIGLFLNQISQEQLIKDKKRERHGEILRAWLRECDKLIQYANIIKKIENEDDLEQAVKDFVLNIDLHDWRTLERICNRYVADGNTSIFRDDFAIEMLEIEERYEEKWEEAGGEYWA